MISQKDRKGGTINRVHVCLKASPFDAFSQTSLMPAFFLVSTGSDAPHGRLLKVKKREFR